jgi:ketose-bisphosphate aldolase
MAIVSAKQMLIKASEEGYCVGAFNCTNIAQLMGVIDAAVNKSAPVIIQASLSPAKFYGMKTLAGIYHGVAADLDIPVCLHLDHCDDVELCKQAADAGFTNIMIDASKHDFEENVRQTKEVCDYCHNHFDDVSVEGELGTVAGVEDQVKVAEDDAQLCDPTLSVEYVQRTGVDLFAPAIGTAHGVYRTENPKIDIERFARINQLINKPVVKAPLIVHGGTGLKEEVVLKLIAAGGAKFNISTDLKYVLLNTTRDYIAAHPDEYNPGKVDKAVRQATCKRVEYFIDLCGSTGKA